MTNQSEPALQIVAPANGAVLSSPLAILRIRYRRATARIATIHVGQVRHVVELKESEGELRENITLLVGETTLRVDIGGETTHINVTLKPSQNVTIAAPTAQQSITTRATDVSGTYKNVSCPAGVIAVNGFMQQFAVRGTEGSFGEKIVLRPGANHVAVQIGELYATQLVTGAFEPSKLLVTLVWDTPSTDVDLYVREPSGQTVYYSSKTHAGNLDVDRTQGFGPENYSLGVAGQNVAPGDYVVRVHYYADRGLGRTEWTVRVLSDEDSGAQQRRNFYGILDYSNSSGSSPGSTGRDWDDVCTIRVAQSGAVEVINSGGAS
jgi:uncharacterized protein YfaP (DUF2135 family)